MSNPIELCIPRVSITISKKRIFDIFVKLNIGYIERIIENPLKNDANYKRIIIRVKWDNNQIMAKQIQETIKENQYINLVYEMPWFWKIYENKSRKEPSHGSTANIVDKYSCKA